MRGAHAVTAGPGAPAARGAPRPPVPRREGNRPQGQEGRVYAPRSAPNARHHRCPPAPPPASSPRSGPSLPDDPDRNANSQGCSPHTHRGAPSRAPHADARPALTAAAAAPEGCSPPPPSPTHGPRTPGQAAAAAAPAATATTAPAAAAPARPGTQPIGWRCPGAGQSPRAPFRREAVLQPCTWLR